MIVTAVLVLQHGTRGSISEDGHSILGRLRTRDKAPSSRTHTWYTALSCCYYCCLYCCTGPRSVLVSLRAQRSRATMPRYEDRHGAREKEPPTRHTTNQQPVPACILAGMPAMCLLTPSAYLWHAWYPISCESASQQSKQASEAETEDVHNQLTSKPC